MWMISWSTERLRRNMTIISGGCWKGLERKEYIRDINEPLRQLLRRDSEFVWDKQHDAAFKKMKDIITREPGPVLAFFDTSKDLILQVDASKYGLGAVMLQEGKPLTYASKSLTDTEISYAQIEKELLAILWGCKRFLQNVYGWHITVEFDHKPLKAIIRNPLAAGPPRLQSMIWQLQKYSFTIVHIPGKDIPVADTLSRKSMPCTDHSLSEMFILYSALSLSVMRSLAIFEKKQKEMLKCPH